MANCTNSLKESVHQKTIIHPRALFFRRQIKDVKPKDMKPKEKLLNIKISNTPKWATLNTKKSSSTLMKLIKS